MHHYGALSGDILSVAAPIGMEDSLLLTLHVPIMLNYKNIINVAQTLNYIAKPNMNQGVGVKV